MNLFDYHIVLLLGSILCGNILGYLSMDILCSKKQTVSFEKEKNV